MGSGLFGFGLRFGSVTGRCRHAPSPKPRPKPKILAPRGYSISSNALAGGLLVKFLSCLAVRFNRALAEAKVTAMNPAWPWIRGSLDLPSLSIGTQSATNLPHQPYEN